MFVNGELSGIICQSGIAGSDGQSRSYGTTLWPLLATTLELSLEGKPPEFITFYELAKRGYVGVTDLNRVQFDSLPDDQVSISYEFDP